MKIAQIAPLIESVPPSLYGGTERVVSYLTEELVRRGHEVTLFASADSITGAELVPCSDQALRLGGSHVDPTLYYVVMLAKLLEREDEFDIFHFHVDAVHFPVFRGIAKRTFTTLHGRQDLPELAHLYRHYPEMPLVSISRAQARAIPDANVVATVHHGIPTALYRPVYDPRGGYVAFLGRMSHEKRPDIAIAIARTLGVPIKLAAKVDRADEAYFDAVVRPVLDQPGVEFVGEVNERQKQDFLGEASALLFPIDWPEPFGLVMIEAMACGTPILAVGNGSVPEVIDDGVSGRVVRTADEAAAALSQTMAIDRRRVRRCFEERFTAGRMADDYLALYRTCLPAVRPAVPTLVPLAPKSEAIGVQG